MGRKVCVCKKNLYYPTKTIPRLYSKRDVRAGRPYMEDISKVHFGICSGTVVFPHAPSQSLLGARAFASFVFAWPRQATLNIDCEGTRGRQVVSKTVAEVL